MRTVHVEESIAIESDLSSATKLFVNFQNWEKWAPWLVYDPEAELLISDDGKSCSWIGRSVGKGDITINNVEENKIDFEVKISAPIPFTAKLNVLLEPQGEQVKVTWVYNERLPFFNWFGGKGKAHEISFDFKRGLEMVKEFLEVGAVDSDLDVTGVQRRFGYEYIGIKRTIPVDKLQEFIIQDFEKLIPYSEANIPERDIPWPFVIYHSWDLENYEVDITTCVSTFETPEEIPEGMILGATQDSRIFTIEHKGGHKNIVNAWRALDYLKKSELIDVNITMDYAAMEYFRKGPIGIPASEIESDFIAPLNEVDLLSNKVYISQ